MDRPMILLPLLIWCALGLSVSAGLPRLAHTEVNWSSEAAGNVNCFCWAAFVNYFPFRYVCSWIVHWHDETVRWDLAMQAAGRSERQHIKTTWILFFFLDKAGFQFDNFMQEGCVLSLQTICVCGGNTWSLCKPTEQTGCKGWSHTCFPATFAIPSCRINVGSGRKVVKRSPEISRIISFHPLFLRLILYHIRRPGINKPRVTGEGAGCSE